MDKRDRKKLGDQIRNAAATRVTLNMTKDTTKMQESQISGLDGEDFPEVERFQNYGFTSNPPAGAEGIAVPVGGDRSHLAVLAIDDRGSRLKGLAPGEVAVYHGNGDFLRFNEGNKVAFETKESVFDSKTKSEFKAPQVDLKGNVTATNYEGGAGTFNFTGNMTIDGNLKVTGNITVTGNVTAGGDVTAGGISLKNHTHPGDSGGTTGKPQ